MRRILLVFLITVFVFSSKIYAQEENYLPYVIDSFSSKIELEQDTSLLVTERIDVNFNEPRHGIFRVIPIIYSAKGKTIKAKFNLLGISDESGNPYPYKKTRLNQSIKLKIGDPDVYVEGENSYVISYEISKVLQRFDDYDEVYWNVTGSEWDTEIATSSVSFSTPFADITDVVCYAGEFGGEENLCNVQEDTNKAFVESSVALGMGRDFSVVISLDNNNSLQFPSFYERLLEYVLDNWGYVAAVFPGLIMFYLWLKRGRDERFLSENIYFKPENTKTKKVPLFERKFIPFVYHPIDNLSPSEVGTIIDEKVHISDVVAEILEMARLGFIKIRRIEKKKLLKDQVEYSFIKTDKFKDSEQLARLKDYQRYLLNELFRSTIVHKSVKEAEKLFKGADEKLSEVRKMLANKEYVLLSAIKNHFYEGLPVFKNKLYKRMGSEGLFSRDPEKVRITWFGIFFVIDFIFAILVLLFTINTYNFGPVFVIAMVSIPAILLAMSMPRRTAKGYSYFRQIEGLKWYLGKGKWRHEVAEKRLFIEDILPLAVALGVVDRITSDMKDLGMKPPTYFAGSSISSFSSDFGRFYSSTSSSFISTPKSGPSGLSSWSGGSGFSGGGFSGGGFGGGGGGSW